MTLDDLPLLEGGVAALYLGTLSLATDPPATAFEDLMAREASNRLVVVDPNIRAGRLRRPGAYVRRFESWADHAHVIKLSDDDADWLFPASPTRPSPRRSSRLERSSSCLRSAGGCDRPALPRRGHRSPRITSNVVDTVGAGDAFGAGLLFAGSGRPVGSTRERLV